jgi:hypothetical protein
MTKFDYFKNWMEDNGYWSAWEKARAAADQDEWKLDLSEETRYLKDAFAWDSTTEDYSFWQWVDAQWDEHLEEIDIDEKIVPSELPNFTVEEEGSVVTEEIQEKTPNWNLSHVLAFYLAVTGKEHITTKEEKNLLNGIIDVANSWEV